MIKKILVSLFLLAITQLILSQNLTSLVTKYADKDSVKHQVIDKVMLALARLTTASKLGNSDLFDKLDQIDILDVAKTSQEIKDSFIKDFNALKENDGYETVLDVDMANDESDSVQIVAKRDGSIITEILVLAKDNEEKEIILVMMSGKLDESDLAELIKQQNK